MVKSLQEHKPTQYIFTMKVHRDANKWNKSYSTISIGLQKVNESENDGPTVLCS